MAGPRVSVVMVTADPHAPYIGEAVDSVLRQSFDEWELIIVDDGPAGAVTEIVGRFNDSRIRYLRQVHAGVNKLGATYNRALLLTKAPLIALLEGDDYWPADKLEIQIPALEQENAVLSYGIVKVVSSNGSPQHRQAPWPEVEKDRGALENNPVGRTAIAMARHWQYVSPASIVVRRSALESIGGFQQPSYYPAVDFPTVLKLATIGPFHYLPSVLGFGRRHHTSVTASVVSGKTYLLGMFRCWLETMQASNIRLSRRDLEPVVAHWQAGFAGHYRVMGRISLEQRDAEKARAYFLASLRGSTGAGSMAALGGALFSYLPQGARLLEACYKLLLRQSSNKSDLEAAYHEAAEIISSFEAWTEALESLCSDNGNHACPA
ncbi:MAG TPA: glycosyltransferase [Blastocatellia bacterium]|nr:glycosyltransferase [Blastocatellia bacterium]